MHNDTAQRAKAIAQRVQIRPDPNAPTPSDHIDRYVAHPFYGLLLFAAIMGFVFTLSQSIIGPALSDRLVLGLNAFGLGIEDALSALNTSSFLRALVMEGMIGGLSAVLSFLPLIMVLFFLLQLLEDSGYMARVALIMDRYFKRIGLAGKSIIPMYVGTACTIPAVMAARTIKNARQRMLTVMLTPFVPCGAKLPVIALFVSVFFTNHPYVTALIYLLAIAIIYLAGSMMKWLLQADTDIETQHLLIELPAYKRPSLKLALNVMVQQAWDFVSKAATLIVLMNTVIWLLSNFSFSLQRISLPSQSMLYGLAQPFAWLMIPLGFGFWGLAAAAIAGFVAKEEVIGALAIIFVFSISEDFGALNIESTRLALTSLSGLTSVSAFAYMAFNLFTPPCFAAIGAMRVELQSRRWLMFAVLFQLSLGYLIAMIIYQVGSVMFLGQLGEGFIASVLILSVAVTSFIALRRRFNPQVSHG
jgi:ferrous iron transport protein B